MARPKTGTAKMQDSRRRPKLTAFRVTEEEFDLIRSRAESRGESLGTYMRDLVLADARTA